MEMKQLIEQYQSDYYRAQRTAPVPAPSAGQA